METSPQFLLHTIFISVNGSDGYLSDVELDDITKNLDHLQIGDQYKIDLTKKDGSLGLNVTVRHHDIPA